MAEIEGAKTVGAEKEQLSSAVYITKEAPFWRGQLTPMVGKKRKP